MTTAHDTRQRQRSSRTTVTDNAPVRNGVDTAALFATLDAVKAQPEIAKFRFRATNRPISGNGDRGIRVSFTVIGDAPAEKLRELIEQSRRRSAVFDIITGSVPVPLDVTTP